MRKVPLVAVIWTMVIAIPFTALALSAVAYITDHLISLAASLAAFSQATSQTGQSWLAVIAERMPEVIGMVVGQLIILVIVLLVRSNQAREPKVK
jgi:hypothetical protein